MGPSRCTRTGWRGAGRALAAALVAGMCAVASQADVAARDGELREAALSGDTAAVEALVTQGHVRDIDAANAAGWTALHLAAVSHVIARCPACAHQGRAGPSRPAARVQRRPVTLIRPRRQYGGHVATVAKLLYLGADVRRVDREGHNLLHFAVSCRKEFCAPRAAILRALMSADPPPRADEGASGSEATAGVASPHADDQSQNSQDTTTTMHDSASQEAVDTRAREKSMHGVTEAEDAL
jgi:hypothetical protein